MCGTRVPSYQETRLEPIGYAYIEELQKELALEHWSVDLTYGPCERFPGAASDCHVNYMYHLVEICVDLEEIVHGDHEDDEEQLKFLLRHELLHAVGHPLLLYRDALRGALTDNPALQAAEQVLWHHANEQLVINMERILDGPEKEQDE